MTIGDPKKAKLLGLVAIGAIGFMVIELIPGSGDQPARSSRRTDEKAMPANGPGGQWRLSRDPFSSPLLVKRQAEVGAATAAPDTLPRPPGPRDPVPGPRQLTGALTLGSLDIGSLPEPRTKERAHSNRAKVSGNETVLTLQATMRIDNEVAMISIGQGDAREFREGARPVSGVQVSAIDADGVVLAWNGRQVRVAVGQAVKI